VTCEHFLDFARRRRQSLSIGAEEIQDFPVRLAFEEPVGAQGSI
jgi:hypothetical protein